jgi:hypothetical protein
VEKTGKEKRLALLDMSALRTGKSYNKRIEMSLT